MKRITWEWLKERGAPALALHSFHCEYGESADIDEALISDLLFSEEDDQDWFINLLPEPQRTRLFALRDSLHQGLDRRNALVVAVIDVLQKMGFDAKRITAAWIRNRRFKKKDWKKLTRAFEDVIDDGFVVSPNNMRHLFGRDAWKQYRWFLSYLPRQQRVRLCTKLTDFEREFEQDICVALGEIL